MKISHLFDDPLVRALCEVAERDEDDSAAILAPAPVLPPLGDASEPQRFTELEAA